MFSPLPVFVELGHFFCYFWLLFLSLSPSISSVSQPYLCFFYKHTHTHPQKCISVSWLIVSSSFPVLHLSLSPLSLHLNHSVFLSLTHSAVHVRGNNGSCECAWNNTAGELLLLNAQRTHTPLPLQSYWHSSNASLFHPPLSLSLDVTLWEKKGKIKCFKKKKKNSHWASAYFVFSATICVCLCFCVCKRPLICTCASRHRFWSILQYRLTYVLFFRFKVLFRIRSLTEI